MLTGNIKHIAEIMKGVGTFGGPVDRPYNSMTCACSPDVGYGIFEVVNF